MRALGHTNTRRVLDFDSVFQQQDEEDDDDEAIQVGQKCMKLLSIHELNVSAFDQRLEQFKSTWNFDLETGPVPGPWQWQLVSPQQDPHEKEEEQVERKSVGSRMDIQQDEEEEEEEELI